MKHTFTLRQRVQLHPATDFWMQGARYGTILSLESTTVAIVAVDMLDGHAVRFNVRDLLPVRKDK